MSREQEIRIGQAVNLAWQTALHFTPNVDDMAEIQPIAEALVKPLLEFINTQQAKVELGGTTVQEAPSAAPTQTAAPAAAPSVQGASDGTSKEEQQWRFLIANPDKFWDNRNNKKNPAGPDFKHKDSGKGLWLFGKYGNAPQFVFDHFGINPNAQPTAVVDDPF